MKNVAKDIRERTFKPVYLLCGDENYLKTNCKQQLKQAIIGEDSMNFHYYEGKGISVEQVIDVAETMPFFADYRLILMENTGFFKFAGGTLPEYLKEKPESTIFVFVESEVDKRNKLYKTVKEIGYVCEMNVPSRNELQRWLLGEIKKAGKQIDRETLELFFNLVGDEDMHTLSNEMEKLESEMAEWKQQDEDVLSYALFPQVAVDFFKYRQAQQEKVDPAKADVKNGAYPV